VIFFKYRPEQEETFLPTKANFAVGARMGFDMAGGHVESFNLADALSHSARSRITDTTTRQIGFSTRFCANAHGGLAR